MSLAGTTIARLPHTPAIAATLAVDVMDKILSDVLHLAPYGRCWFHTLLSVAACTAIVTAWKGKEWGLSWCLGHFLHLIGDIGFIPWFYPFISYQWPDSPNVVQASVKALEETVSGFQVVRDATGTIQLSGWDYSETVLNIFKGKLLILESIMLGCITAVAVYQHTLRRKTKAILLSIFTLAMVFRLFYDFPAVIIALQSVLGDWVLV